MRASLAPLAILLILTACPALAGAWPRDKGGWFVSLRADTDAGRTGRGTSGSLYGEYGLTDRITVVGQLSNDDAPWTVSRAGLGLNYALSPLDARHRFALSFGVSAPPDTLGVMTDTRIESGLHWGMGFESPLGGGWATVTARVLQPVMADGDLATDLFGLVGLRPRDGWMTMLSTGRFEDEAGVTWKVTPSLGYQLRDTLWIVPGVTREVGGAGVTTLNLSLWLSF